ncbi:MAG: gluconate 2-dehydrogenase subunit 3 family protein, partial [bacterium]|nr:gluconate 2-dehydrogenase subunit 3 family protein [bacterium]
MSDSNLTRRDLLRTISAAAIAGGFSLDGAQHVHQMATREKQDAGAYEPKLFKPHEYRTLDTLAELIVPGAGKGGAKEFIDLLASANDELAAIFTGGLGWLDRQMHREHGVTFADASSERQTALLDRIAYTENTDDNLEPGVRFFTWVRK